MTVSQRGTPVIATGTTSVTGTWPTGSTQVKGDLLVAVVGGYGSTSNVAAATPAGWTLLESTNNFSPPVWTGIYTKVAAGGDSAPAFSITATGSTNMACVLYDLSDSSGLTPQITVSGSNFGTTGTITATTGGNVPSPGCFAISGAICGDGTTSLTTTWTTPSNWSLGGDQTTANVSQLASYYYSSPPSGSTLSCLFTHSRASTIQAAALIVAQPPVTGALSVIATMSGNPYEGMALNVVVLTGASGATGTTGTATGTTGHVSITPAASGSWIYGAVDDANANTTLTPETGNTFSLTLQDAYNTAAYGTFRSTATTTSGTPVVMGTSAALTGGGVAAVEIEAAGTLAEYGSENNEVENATSCQTYWFLPPPGSLLVAQLATEGATGTATATVADTLGLTWTQVVHVNSGSGDGYSGVWIAQVPSPPYSTYFPAVPGFAVPGAATPGVPSSTPAVFHPLPFVIVRARLPQQPLLRGRITSNPGAPVQNPVPSTGPVFYPARQAIRARLPQQPVLRGRTYSSPPQPVRNPTPGPVFRLKPAPVRYVLPPWQPRAGRIGSSFGAPVVNPIHGPPVYAPLGPVRARLPWQPLLRGRVAASPGAPLRNPVPGPVFHPAVRPARTPVPQAFSKGRTYSNAGAPPHNPTTGPVFRQAVSPARTRITLPPRGRIASSPGGPVQNPAPIVTGPPFYPLRFPARAKIPQNAPRGRVASNAGAPARNPVQGAVFPAAHGPARIHAALAYSKGRTSGNPGAPLQNPSSGPAFRQAVHPAAARLPAPFLKGRTGSNTGAPVRNPGTGPVFRPAVRPARAVIPEVFSKGRTGSNPGTVKPPAPVPAYPLQGPVRIRTTAPFSKGHIQSSPGAPVKNPASGPVFRQAVKPARAVIPRISPRGRIYSGSGAPVHNPPPPVIGAPFSGMRQAVRARYLNQVYVLGDPGLIYVDSRDGTP